MFESFFSSICFLQKYDGIQLRYRWVNEYIYCNDSEEITQFDSSRRVRSKLTINEVLE